MIFFEEEESLEVVETSMEHRDPTAMFAEGEREAERCDDVPMSRKCAVSADAIAEWDAKRTWSPHPSVASLVSSPPIVDMAERARQSEERACTHASLGPVPAHDS